MKCRLDLFGVLVLSFAAATSGGIFRDLLIGSVPPAAIGDWRYLGVASVAGTIGFFWPARMARLRSPVLLFDAGGLALFAVSGTQKALAFGLHPVMAALLGMLTGIGGGIVRDILLAEVPLVLRKDLYAVAALAGALVVVPVICCASLSSALMWGARFYASASVCLPFVVAGTCPVPTPDQNDEGKNRKQVAFQVKQKVTVNHVTYVLGKLNAEDRTKAVITA